MRIRVEAEERQTGMLRSGGPIPTMIHALHGSGGQGERKKKGKMIFNRQIREEEEGVDRKNNAVANKKLEYGVK